MSLVPDNLTPKRKRQILEELLKEDSGGDANPSSQEIEFEKKALYSGNDKKIVYYNQSLSELKNRKYERHARPIEVFGLLIANLENKLTAEQKAIAQDMVNSYGEWLSLAIERKGNELICYEDPENLVWDAAKNLYVVQGKLKYGNEKKFSIKNIKSSEWIDLQNFDKHLQKYLYGREWKDLPNEMKAGNLHAQLALPPDKTIWPAGRGIYWYVVNCRYYYYWASRGVQKNV